MNMEPLNGLEEIRIKIDRLDRLIIKLIAERQDYVKRAAQFKKSENDVKAPARVEAVINKVRALAIDDELDPNIAETVYRTMITCFIKKELKEFQHKILE